MTQKDSTKDTETKSPKKESRRSRTKHPALNKGYNLKMRQDYIETDYINGVYNKDGEKVIRAMNEEERDFLNAFYEEVIGANFLHNKQLKNIHVQMRELKKKETLTQEEEDTLMGLQMEYFALADEALLYPDQEDQRKLYGENNARNRCMYNRSKSIGILDELNDSTYDEFHRNIYNDKDSGENLMHNQVEPRLKEALKKKWSKD